MAVLGRLLASAFMHDLSWALPGGADIYISLRVSHEISQNGKRRTAICPLISNFVCL